MAERWRGPLLLLVLAWVLLSVALTAVNVAGYVAPGGTPRELLYIFMGLGSIAVGVWILRTFRHRRADSN